MAAALSGVALQHSKNLFVMVSETFATGVEQYSIVGR